MSSTRKISALHRLLSSSRVLVRRALDTRSINILECRHLFQVIPRLLSTQTATEPTYNRNRNTGSPNVKQKMFQSDTQMLLLYTSLSGSAAECEQPDHPLEIQIGSKKQERILTVHETSIGMIKEQLMNNLGTIAHSESKRIVEQMKEAGQQSLDTLIGQFGVGFYAAFMVADKLEVYTRATTVGAPGCKWSSDGSGLYEIVEAEGVAVEAKIVIHLKGDCREYADENWIQAVIKMYSNFVGSPIFLNGHQTPNHHEAPHLDFQ